jgi:hypothetical protein
MADDNELPPIAIDQLAAVTGGAGDPFADMLPMMMMMMMMRGRQQQTVVAAPAAPTPGDGWVRVA